jgi:hypothetical protein
MAEMVEFVLGSALVLTIMSSPQIAEYLLNRRQEILNRRRGA